MRILFTTLKALTCAIFILSLSSLAQAAATRTWVSGVGNDENPCSRTAPCKTFAGAISKTSAGGEIDCLDAGGFGAVTLTKSVTIDGNGTFASILAAGTTGVTVNDASSGSPNTIIVTLRNLSINGAGTGFKGISFSSGKALHVENCQIFGFKAGSGYGIDVNLSAVASGNQRVLIKDTIIRQNLGAGIRASNTAAGGAVSVTIEGVQVSNCGVGVSAGTSSKVLVRNSTFALNTNAGIEGLAGQIGLDVWGCLIHSNGTSGIVAAAANNRITDNYITNNSVAGVNLTGGTVDTYGDNRIDNNGTNVLGGSLGTGISKR